MIALAGVLLAGVLALPVDVPYTVSTVGKVLPAAEWVLVRDTDGSIGTLLRDHLHGTVLSADVHHFERGDAVRYELHPKIRARKRVELGDTVLHIHSNETARQMAAASGEAAAARLAVSLYASGEKASIVRAAEQQLERAVEQAEQQRRRVERLRTLRERQLVAEQELEDAQSLLDIYEAEAAIARSELESVSTGAKSAQLDLAQTEAEARRREMQTLSARVDMQTILAPISGITVRSYGSDTLLTIRDISAAIVVMPVPRREQDVLNLGQHVRITFEEAELTMTGRIVEFGETVHRVDRNQVVMVTARLDEIPSETVAGALVSCAIEAEPVRLFEYVRRKIR